MPEGLEAEIHRRAAAVIVRRRITAVTVDAACGDPVAISGLVGARVLGVGRAGKHVARYAGSPHTRPGCSMK